MKNKASNIVAIAIVTLVIGVAVVADASSTSEFSVTINPGTLSVDIVDGSFVSVATPTVSMSAQTFSFSCGTTTGTFGTTSERLYVSNPDAADNGWTVSLAAAATTSKWESAASSTATFDFNDTTTGGCADGSDPDSIAGSMNINPSGGTISTGNCASCGSTGVSLGSHAIFTQGSVDSITIFSGNASSNDIGDWYVTGVDVGQTIPSEQAAHSDYTLDLTLSVVAS